MKKLYFLSKIFILIYFSCFDSFALAPEKRLENNSQENRAQQIFKEIKCLVCEAQSIYGSNTEFSRQLRGVIRQKIKQNYSNYEIKEDLKSEFGSQILMSGDIKSDILPWIMPFLFALILGLVIFRKKINVT